MSLDENYEAYFAGGERGEKINLNTSVLDSDLLTIFCKQNYKLFMKNVHRLIEPDDRHR